MDDVAKTRKLVLEDKVAKYMVPKPIALGFSAGVIDYNRMGFIARKGSRNIMIYIIGMNITFPVGIGILVQ